VSKSVVSPAWGWLGISEVSQEDGVAVVEMTPTGEMANSMGLVHGGMISALADSAMGRALRTIKPEVVRSMSFDLKLSFISAAKVGETLRATGRVVHGGRRTAVTECRVEVAPPPASPAPPGERGGPRLVATASATFAVTREEGITRGSNAD
jgi:uncharacterized protein (TIGR00369 family)